MQKVLILKGLPASGKSTYAFELIKKEPNVWKRINKDTLRAMVDNGEYTRKNEKAILEARNALISAFLDAGHNVIVDDTNLVYFHEKMIRSIAAGKKDVEVEVKEFDVPLEVCIERDAKRGGREHVGEKVIRDMWERHYKPQIKPLSAEEIAGGVALNQNGQRYLADPALPTAVICDIDGTLALHNDRSPFDYARVGEDAVNSPIAFIANKLASQFPVTLLSGRDEVCRKETMEWLARHGIPYSALIMRKHGDNRKDSIVKQEMFDQHIRGKHNVLCVLDDRDQVVRMWRGLGLTCLQVAEGNF